MCWAGNNNNNNKEAAKKKWKRCSYFFFPPLSIPETDRAKERQASYKFGQEREKPALI